MENSVGGDRDTPLEEPAESATPLSICAEEQLPAVSTRTYNCTFCKMGFSNAQALGGHMNIHRKERAKIVKFQSSSSSSSATAAMIDSNISFCPASPFPFVARSPVQFQWLEILEATSHIHEAGGPSTASEEDGDQKKGSESSRNVHGGLDLELRLGHDPPQDSAAGRK